MPALREVDLGIRRGGTLGPLGMAPGRAPVHLVAAVVRRRLQAGDRVSARKTREWPNQETAMDHPFADLIAMQVHDRRAGASTLRLDADQRHLNPHQVVHGAVIYALADTGMGAALYPTLAPGEQCATIEIKINYFKPALPGALECRTELVNRGRTVANLEARVYQGGRLVAQANGNFAIFTPKAAS